MRNHARSIAAVDLGRFDSPVNQARFAARSLGSQTVLHQIVRRLSDAALVDEIVVTGTHLPATLLSGGLAGVEFLDVPSEYGCERLAAVADRYGADWIVYVPANRPFVDPVLVDRLLARGASETDCDYIGFTSSDGGWLRSAQLGLCGEVCHGDALRRLRRHIEQIPKAKLCAPSVAAWLQEAPGAYRMRLIPLPSELDHEDLRFTVEDESDWDDAAVLCEAIGNERTEWQSLADLISDNHSMRRSMQSRNQHL